MIIKEVFDGICNGSVLEDNIKSIAYYYGMEHQLKKLSEEMFELTEAILADLGSESVEEEYADVLVVLSQIAELAGVRPHSVVSEMLFKAERQVNRINED